MSGSFHSHPNTRKPRASGARQLALPPTSVGLGEDDRGNKVWQKLLAFLKGICYHKLFVYNVIRSTDRIVAEVGKKLKTVAHGMTRIGELPVSAQTCQTSTAGPGQVAEN